MSARTCIDKKHDLQDRGHTARAKGCYPGKLALWSCISAQSVLSCCMSHLSVC